MEFAVLDPQTNRKLARVYLNGHVIQAGGPLGQAGAMRSFTLLEGSLRDQWAYQRPLILRKEDGREAAIRIAALPVEEGEVGFVEFL
jgi:hypothetical protein